MGSHILITPIQKCILWGRTNKKWCYKCRKNLIHYKVTIVWDTAYYEPTHQLCCSGCGEEHLKMF